MKYARCPNCDVRYPLKRLNLGDKTEATTVCSVCACQFQVSVRRRWWLLRKVGVATRDE